MQAITVILLAVYSALSEPVQAQLRHYGGLDASISEYPFMVAIAYGGVLVGNGAILTDIWIISSASAFQATPDSAFRASVGGDSFGSGANYEASRVYKHPEYVNWDYNLAMMRLNRKIKFSNTAQPISLPTSDPNMIDIILLSYGQNEQGTKHLRSATYSLATDDACVGQLFHNLAKEMITDGRGFCMYPSGESRKGQFGSDAGAPAVDNNVLYGVFAFSENEGGYSTVGVVTRIASFKPWIEQTLQKTGY